MRLRTNIQPVSHEEYPKDQEIPSFIVPIDSIKLDNSIPQTILNIEEKNRSNLLPWKGQFSPQLIDVLLNHYTNPNYFILDPFLGSGTVLVEGARKNLRAFGTEINPAAFIMANIYTFSNLKRNQRYEIIKNFENLLNKNFFEKYDFFKKNSNDNLSDELKKDLISLIKNERDRNIICIIEALIILLDFYKTELTTEKIYTTWYRIKEIILSLPYSDSEISLSHADARNIPLPDSVIDLVITSPPYINVFNYHQQYRASVEAMGWKLLNVTKSEIGSNRKNRGNRFLTVVQYILDMYDAFLELRRVCKPDARIIIIIGRESNVRKTQIFNSPIIASLGKISGFEILFRQERTFINRYGTKIYEDIIHFKNNGKPFLNDTFCIRHLAEQILSDAMSRVPDESRADLYAAITSIENVKKSPLYKRFLMDNLIRMEKSI